VKCTCPKCGARHELADDKVPSSVVLRFTCKSCGDVTRLRREADTLIVVAAPEASRAVQPPPAPRPPLVSGPWYVLIGREPRGPFSNSEIATLLEHGEVSGHSYVWCAGLQGWVPLGMVEVFASVSGLRQRSQDTRTDLHSLATVAGTLKAQSAASSSLLEGPSAGLPPTQGVPVTGGPRSPDGATAAGEVYQASPPGEATRTFMATAGLYQRRRRQRLALGIGITGTLALVALVALDLGGVLALPGMGALYDATGFVDPNLDRAVKRIQSKLEGEGLTAEEREVLRQKLLGLEGRKHPAPNPTPAAVPRVRRKGAAGAPAVSQIGLPESRTLGAKERRLADTVFSDGRKREAGPRLADPAELVAPNLPSGLTQEAIFQVINENSRSMKLCLEDAFKKGERVQGRMELEVDIAADGSVLAARVTSPQFRGSALASCTIRRVKGWRFPRFKGEPVTVTFPYVLSAGL
jgi:hypothetical protein